jgi:stress responsive alpha/beta barrel protein
MIAHVILFKPKAELSDGERQMVLDGLSAAARGIPAIKKLRVGQRVKHGLPGYEQAMHENFEYAVIVEVDDIEGLKAYLAHPLHQAIGGHFTQSSSAALAYDYEMQDL